MSQFDPVFGLACLFWFMAGCVVAAVFTALTGDFPRSAVFFITAMACVDILFNPFMMRKVMELAAKETEVRA